MVQPTYQHKKLKYHKLCYSCQHKVLLFPSNNDISHQISFLYHSLFQSFLFKEPTLPPFLKSLFPLPSSLVHLLFRYFRQFPSLTQPSPALIRHTNLPSTYLMNNRYQKGDFTSSTVAFYQKSNFDFLNRFTNKKLS